MSVEEDTNVDVQGSRPVLCHSLERRSIKEMICEKLALLVASGVLHVGDSLPGERELSSAFGVSRESVRGAIQILASRGVIDVSHGTRTRVISEETGSLQTGLMPARGIDRYKLDDVHRARILIERHLVLDAVDALTEATLALLDSLLEKQAKTIGDPVRFMICDREFHAAIYHASGNVLLADLAMDLYAYVMEQRLQVMSVPGAIAQSLEDHKMVVDRFRARDREGAAAAFLQHLEHICQSTKDFQKDARKRNGARPVEERQGEHVKEARGSGWRATFPPGGGTGAGKGKSRRRSGAVLAR